MNREEAIAVFEEIKVNYEADPDWGAYDGVFSRRNLSADAECLEHRHGAKRRRNDA